MATTIKCDRCGHSIEITQAIKAELEAKVLAETQQRYQAQLDTLEREKLALIEAKDKEIQDTKKQITETARKEAIDKVRQEYDAKISATKDEAVEQAKQNQDLQNQIKELFKQLRETKGEKEKLELEYQKRLMEEEAQIKRQAKTEAQEELNLQLAQKDKKLSDAEKQILELQRKLQQGSQQLQGEVQELQLETRLKQEFIYDEITPVPKGINGADVIQLVKTPNGHTCGTIVWESKNTRNWSPGWIAKLKADQRTLKAEVAVLVSAVLPEGMCGFGVVEGILVTEMKSALGLAYVLRQQLHQIQGMKVANQGRASKAETVYNYLLSNEFRQRLEVWAEYFHSRREELDKEKCYYQNQPDYPYCQVVINPKLAKLRQKFSPLLKKPTPAQQ